MHLASIVSERFGFAIPAGYVRMTEAGLLCQAKYANAMTERAKSKADSRSAKAANAVSSKGNKSNKGNKARALATSDVHWLSASEIVARIEKHGGRAWRPRWPLDFVFVPFAESTEGDEWGWAPSLGEPGASEPPVMCVPHDSEDARIIAPTFATFLFRMTLEALAVCPHEASQMALGERVAMLRGSARVVLDFLPAELSARLDRVLDLPVRKVTVRTLREKNGKFFRTNESTHLSLVASDWAARIVREELEDARVDQPLRIDA
jgi:hypothetical protein